MDKIINENPNLLKDYRNTVAYKRYKDRMLKDEK